MYQVKNCWGKFKRIGGGLWEFYRLKNGQMEVKSFCNLFWVFLHFSKFCWSACTQICRTKKTPCTVAVSADVPTNGWNPTHPPNWTGVSPSSMSISRLLKKKTKKNKNKKKNNSKFQSSWEESESQSAMKQCSAATNIFFWLFIWNCGVRMPRNDVIWQVKKSRCTKMNQRINEWDENTSATHNLPNEIEQRTGKEESEQYSESPCRKLLSTIYNFCALPVRNITVSRSGQIMCVICQGLQRRGSSAYFTSNAFLGVSVLSR